MNLRQIELFVAIVQTGSFSGGAEATSLTQSTVSQHIAALEDEIGLLLFDRIGRGVVLTSGGRLFLQHARRIIAERDALLQSMNGFQGLENASLTIGASNIPANYLVPTLLPTLRQKHPGIMLTMITGDTAEMLQALQENEVELALVGNKVADKTVDFMPLLSDPLVLVVSREHPWARQGRIVQEQLFTEALIVRESGSGSGQALERAMKQAGHDPARLTIAARLGSNEAVLQATASGCGCAFVSELSVKSWRSVGDLRTVEIDDFVIDRWIWLATLKGRNLSPAAQAFGELLKARYSD